jgi:hypothetical protein
MNKINPDIDKVPIVYEKQPEEAMTYNQDEIELIDRLIVKLSGEKYVIDIKLLIIELIKMRRELININY